MIVELVAGGEPVAFSLTLEAAEAWESELERTDASAEPVPPDSQDV